MAGFFPEIAYNIFVKVDGYRLFQCLRIRIYPRIKFFDIIFFTHIITSLKLFIVHGLFSLRGFSCRYYPYSIVVSTIAVADKANAF